MKLLYIYNSMFDDSICNALLGNGPALNGPRCWACESLVSLCVIILQTNLELHLAEDGGANGKMKRCDSAVALGRGPRLRP